MRETRYEKHLNHEPVVVSDFLADLCNDGKWRTEVTNTELLSGIAGQAGAVYRETVSWEGLFAPATLTVAEVQRGSRLVIVAEDPGYRAVYEYEFVAVEDRSATDLRLLATVQTTGPVQLIEPFLWAMVTRWLERGFDVLDNAITAGHRD